MKLHPIFIMGVSLTFWVASSLLLTSFGQQSAGDETVAILNLVRRGYGSVLAIAKIDNYARLEYGYGQNGGRITFKRSNGQWRIIDGSPQGDYCFPVDCLVKKGVPAPVANRLNKALDAHPKRDADDLKSFQQAWAKKNRSIVPFLGYWQNLSWQPRTNKEITISILPSYTPNKICLVGISENSQYVRIGQVSGKKLATSSSSYTLDRSEAEGISLSSNRDDFFINPLRLNNWYFSADTKQKLSQAGCTNSLPN
ncbi:MAG TPA: hypothetical protein V6D12_04345 [Candidatus Obscuribacterales bacterium]